MKYEPAYEENEYYEMIAEMTANGNCDKCTFYMLEDCHLQCSERYYSYLIKDERNWKELMGLN